MLIMPMLTLPPTARQLDPEDDQRIAALTRRLTQAAREAHVLAPRGCENDFLVPLLRPDLVTGGAIPAGFPNVSG